MDAKPYSEQGAVQEWCAAAVGEGEEEMTAIARDSGYRVRVVERDGRPMVVTRDLRTDRINFSIENGKVRRAYVG